MITTDTEDPQVHDAFGDSWAQVLISLYEQLQERGELPEDDADQPEEGDSPCPTT